MSAPKLNPRETYYDFCRANNPTREVLHRLWYQEVQDNIKWIEKNHPFLRRGQDMEIYDIAVVLGLDWGGRAVQCDTFKVLGEGVWSVLKGTSQIIFENELSFMDSPDMINYEVTYKIGGKSEKVSYTTKCIQEAVTQIIGATIIDIKIKEPMRLTSPECIVNYFLREKKLKTQKINDVAEYLVIRDMKDNVNDDINDFRDMIKKIKHLFNQSEKLPLGEMAEFLNISRDSLSSLVRKLRSNQQGRKK